MIMLVRSIKDTYRSANNYESPTSVSFKLCVVYSALINLMPMKHCVVVWRNRQKNTCFRRV